MCSVYYAARLISDIKKKTYLVAGTSNKSELYVGYFTKGGDSVHDISTIADFTVDEVIAIGEYLKVPEKVLYKKPNDGLSNQTDEDKLGVKYSQIEQFINGDGSIDKDAKNGEINILNLVEYTKEVSKVNKLSENDLKYLPYVYLIQLARSTFGYEEYFKNVKNKEELLNFAFYRTNICRDLSKKAKEISKRLLEL